MKTWKKLERALLLAFRAEYGRIPFCNSQGNRIKETDEHPRSLFQRGKPRGFCVHVGRHHLPVDFLS